MTLKDVTDWLRVRAFMKAINRQVQEGHSVVILYQYGPNNSFKEMGDPVFRARCSKMLADNPMVVCARFSPPDSYDDWTFSAYPKPASIQPGHCRVCDHHAIQDGRCQNISCRAIQRHKPAPIDIG